MIILIVAQYTWIHIQLVWDGDMCDSIPGHFFVGPRIYSYRGIQFSRYCIYSFRCV